MPEPVEAGAVTSTVYVPSLLSETEPTVPVPVPLVTVTVSPPAVKLLPFASFARTVRVAVDDPSAVIEADVGVRVAVAASAAPGVTRIELDGEEVASESPVERDTVSVMCSAFVYWTPDSVTLP